MSDEFADKEVLEAFSQELAQIKVRLVPLFEKMRTEYQNGKLFEQFGQVIYGIYGTAATLGFKEVADYCMALQSVNTLTSQMDNMYVRGQVKEFNLTSIGLFDKFVSIILNPAEVRKIQYAMQKERGLMSDLTKKYVK